MKTLSIQEMHYESLLTTQQILYELGWHTLSVNVLSNQEKIRLARGIEGSRLNWKWAMSRYSSTTEEGILDISLKVVGHHSPEALHAVIIGKYDVRRQQFILCMLENFIYKQKAALVGKVLIIALIYATTFCDIAELKEIYIQDPTPEARPRYVSWGFAQVWDDPDKMSAEVDSIRLNAQQKVQDIILNG